MWLQIHAVKVATILMDDMGPLMLFVMVNTMAADDLVI